MSIYSCDHGSFIVAYTERNCPVCELEGKYAGLEESYDELDAEFEAYKKKYDFETKVKDAIYDSDL